MYNPNEKQGLGGAIARIAVGAVLAFAAIYFIIYGAVLMIVPFPEEVAIVLLVIGILCVGISIPLIVTGAMGLSKRIRHNAGVNRMLKAQRLQAQAQYQAQYQPQYAYQPQYQPQPDPTAALENFKRLYEDGLITAEEYEAKRKEILGL